MKAYDLVLLFLKKMIFVLGMIYIERTPFLHKLGWKRVIFRGFSKFFQNYWIPIRASNISLETSKNMQVDEVLGQNLGQIRSNVMKKVKK